MPKNAKKSVLQKLLVLQDINFSTNNHGSPSYAQNFFLYQKLSETQRAFPTKYFGTVGQKTFVEKPWYQFRIVFGTRTFRNTKRAPSRCFTDRQKVFDDFFVILPSMSHQKFCTGQEDSAKNFQKQYQKGYFIKFSVLWYCVTNCFRQFIQKKIN